VIKETVNKQFKLFSGLPRFDADSVPPSKRLFNSLIVLVIFFKMAFK